MDQKGVAPMQGKDLWPDDVAGWQVLIVGTTTAALSLWRFLVRPINRRIKELGVDHEKQKRAHEDLRRDIHTTIGTIGGRVDILEERSKSQDETSNRVHQQLGSLHSTLSGIQTMLSQQEARNVERAHALDNRLTSIETEIRLTREQKE